LIKTIYDYDTMTVFITFYFSKYECVQIYDDIVSLQHTLQTDLQMNNSNMNTYIWQCLNCHATYVSYEMQNETYIWVKP